LYRLLYGLGVACVRHKYIVLLMWAVVVVAVAGAVMAFGARTDNEISLPGTGAQKASDLLSREFPGQQNGQSSLVFHAGEGDLTGGSGKRAVQDALAAVRDVPHVTSVTGPYTRAGRSLVAEDGRTVVAKVTLDVSGPELTLETAQEVLTAAQSAQAAGVQVEAGGPMGAKLSKSRPRSSEVIGVVAAVVILAVTFGSLVAAGMPILTALVGVVTGVGLVGLLGHVMSIPDAGPTVATMIGLGVGIDYALFIVFQHRDQLLRGAGVEESVARTMASSGSAVVFAGSTVIIALLALLLARVPILGGMGYAAGMAVLVAVLAAITLLPAALAVLGRRLLSLPVLGDRRSGRASDGDNIWARWAGWVTRHPWESLIAALLVLLPLAAPVLTLTLGQEDAGVTPESTTQRRAFDLITDGLGAGANGAIVVAAELDPAATPSATYVRRRDEAEKLADEIETARRRLERQGEGLERREEDLTAQRDGLTARSAALTSQKASLEQQAAALKEQEVALEREGDQLKADKRRLASQSEALTTQGEELAARIAAVQAEIAASQDPAKIAELQAELAGLLAQAEELKTQKAALQKQAAALQKEAVDLQARGEALSARAAGVKAEGASLQSQAGSLQAQGASLAGEGEALRSSAADLREQKRELERKADRAKELQHLLEEQLTDAGGEPMATDARLVRLQDALTDAAGVESVAPPRVNETGTAATLRVTATTRPADPATADLVDHLTSTVIPAATADNGVVAYVGGQTAAASDLAALISDRLPLVVGAVLALSFLVLLVAFRSVLVPLKAILCNLLAVAASFGVLTAVFQWGWGLELVGLSNSYGTVPIVSYVPLLMFAVLFGMSTDYEVFLISRIFEFHAAGEDARQSVRSGVGTSARVITAAALIMIVVFGSFILNGDPVIKEFGVGLSVAILLDATIVRLVIVPATMVLLGEWNWYLPSWLRWLPRVDVPDEATPPASQPSSQPASEVAP
jgi:uncharacterized membrane protein YdfJ with MMPL/SSD domain